MANLFRTADTGKEYSVKSVTFKKQINAGAGLSIYPGIFINTQVDLTIDYAQQNFTTAKKIIPIYYSLSYFNDDDASSFIMSTPYFYASQYTTTPIIPVTQSLVIMSKIIPYSNQATNPIIGFQWNNIDWNETDFIDPSSGLQLVYDIRPEMSLNFKPEILNIPGTVTYLLISSTFLYLELQ